MHSTGGVNVQDTSPVITAYQGYVPLNCFKLATRDITSFFSIIKMTIFIFV